MRARRAAALLLGLALLPARAAARPRVVITVPADRLAAAAALAHTPGASLGRSVELPAADLGLGGPLRPGACATPGLSLGLRPSAAGELLRVRLDLAEAGPLPWRLRTRCVVFEGDVHRDIRVVIRRVAAAGP
ncbi:MAG: hypothetical protein JNM72_02660 [Deltaproteobacteria bacterium]|nr:hypothetical protein [Deltaproteobacteria bacterium]